MMDASRMAGAATLVSLIFSFLGAQLHYMHVLHYFAGSGSQPHEAMNGVNVSAAVFLSAQVVATLYAVIFFLSGKASSGSQWSIIAFMTGVLSVRNVDESLIWSGDMLRASVALLVTAVALTHDHVSAMIAGITSANPDEETEKEMAKQQKKPLKEQLEDAKTAMKEAGWPYHWLVIPIFYLLFVTSKPQASCFAHLHQHRDQIGMSEELIGSKGFEFGDGFRLDLAHDQKESQITVSYQDREVYASPVGSSAVVAAFSGDFDAPNGHEMGTYAYSDRATDFSVVQMINSVMPSKGTPGGLDVNGILFFDQNRSVDFTLTFSSGGADFPGQLDFRLRTSSPVGRLYLKQKSHKEEGVYGMGLQYTYSNLKGGCVPVFTAEQGIGRGMQPVTWIVNLIVPHASGSWASSYSPAPYYLTSDVRSTYLTTSTFSLFDFSSNNRIVIEVNASDVSGVMLVADTPLQLVERYTARHAGRMRPLPDWTGNGAIMGLQGGTDKVRDHVSKLRAGNVPLAALWLQDWTGKRETDFGRRLQWNWEVSHRHYPGWNEYIRELAKENVYVLSYINTYLANTGGLSGESTTLFQEALEEDCLIKEDDGKTVQIQASATPDFTFGTVDITSPKCRQWYINKVIRERMIMLNTTSKDNVNGVLGFMADFAESISMGVKMHGGKEGHEVHNDFPMLWAKTCKEAFEMNDFTKENSMFFTRAGSGTTPKHTSLMWMGDQLTTWDAYDGIKSALAGMLSSGISGFSLGHSDIGGYTMFSRFFGSIKIRRTPELFMRWSELNVFSDAVFRTHEGVLPDISAQASDDSVISHFAKFSELHKQLFKLVKKPLMKEAYETGAPLARHMLLHYPHDALAQKAVHQFMLGDSILVCPVLDHSENSVRCYVPKPAPGQQGNWKHVFSGETPAIGEHFECDAPIGKPCVLTLPKAENVAETIRTILL